MNIALLVKAISAALMEAPNYLALAAKAKAFFSELFTQKMIMKEQQLAVHSHIDAILEARRKGVIPPEFTVEEDPK